MFAPEGYFGFEVMSDYLRDWAHRIVLAHLFETEGRTVANVFSSELSAEQSLMAYRASALNEEFPNFRTSGGGSAFAEIFKRGKEDDFVTTILFHCMLAKVLLKSDTLLAFPDGRVLKPDSYIFIHQDRLDCIYPKWPLRANSDLGQIFEYFDTGPLTSTSIAERYCFLDFHLGVIRMKNGSARTFERCSHFGDELLSRRYVSTHVDPFLGAAVVWSDETDFSEFPQFLEDIGVLGASWGVSALLQNKAIASSKPKRGAKPTGAKDLFFSRYPHGKPPGISGDAIAKELEEAGHPITGRMVNMWHKEMTN